MERKKLIVDCDAGIDDAVALIILIAAHKMEKVEILAITCVNGNTTLENVIVNVYRILNAFDSTDIPVFKGASSPLLLKENDGISVDDHHGSDGFGDVYTDSPDISQLQTEDAVHALHRIAKQFSEKVSVVCLAPLTNIALTIKVFPDFISHVQEFYIMGGSDIVQGDIAECAEFNFHSDPESTHIVLFNSCKPLWLLPWETCVKSTVTHKWRKEVFGKIDTPWVEMLNIIENGMQAVEQTFDLTYKPCDAFLTAIIVRPNMVRDTVWQRIGIELHQRKTRGHVILDHGMSKEPNVRIIRDIDWEIFKEVLIFAGDPFNYRGNLFE